MPSSPRRAGDVGEGQTGNVRTLSANIKKKGIFPVVLNRTVGLGKGKKGSYPRFGKNSAHNGSFVFCMRQTVF